MPESKPYGGQNNPFLGALFTDPSRRSHYSTLHAQANRGTKRSPKSTLFPSLESLQITTLSIFGSPSPAPPPNQLSLHGPQTLLSRGTQHLPVINFVLFRCQPLAFRIRLLRKKANAGCQSPSYAPRTTAVAEPGSPDPLRDCPTKSAADFVTRSPGPTFRACKLSGAELGLESEKCSEEFSTFPATELD